MLPLLAEEAKERQRAAGGDHGNQHTGGKMAVSIKRCEAPKIEDQSSHANRASHIAGKIVGVSGAVVDRMKTVTKESPELAEEVKQGVKTVNQAYQEIKTQKEAPHVCSAVRPRLNIFT